MRRAEPEHRHARHMTDFTDRLMALWNDPVPDGAAGDTAFASCYAERLTINGTPLTRADLVTQARGLQATYSDVRREVAEVVEAADRLAVAFVMHVRHTGPMTTPLGVVQPTGRTASFRVIDILTMRDGVITDVAVVADQLDQLIQLNAVRLA
jgi:predicted ester cyclase